MVEAPQPAEMLVQNLMSDSIAARVPRAYVRAYARPVPGPSETGRRVVSESQLMTIAGRFFHPVLTRQRSVSFYRCAGINGIQELGAGRIPQVEAFVFWGLAPAIFDADSATATARELDSDFARAKATFRSAVEQGDYLPASFASARDALYMEMSNSGALRSLLRDAYVREDAWLPFVVKGWSD